MQFMQMLKASLIPRRNIFASLVMVGVVAAAMGLAPTKGASNTLAQDCANPPSTPTFNYWPVTYDDENTPFCHDFPAIDAALDVPNPQWSQSEADWNNGLTLQVGQQAAAGMYIHNGAANNLDPNLTTARNVHIITQTDTAVGPTHLIQVTFTADNAPTYTKSFTIHTPANAKLEVIPNSGYMYDYMGRVILDQQNLNLGNSDYTLGDLDACFEYSLFLTFKFKVVTAADTGTTLTIDKKVKNLTLDPNTGRGAVYYDTVNAKKNEEVGYRIAVTNTGTTVANNVTVTDSGVNGITVNSGSTAVGIADDIDVATGWSGSLPGTVNLGNIPAGETRFVKYSGKVTTDICPTLVNTARAVATNAPQVSDTASVVVTNCGPVGTAQLAITKGVRNITTDDQSGRAVLIYDSTVSAKKGEKVGYKVIVTNTGTAVANNVTMSDAGVAGISIDANSLRVRSIDSLTSDIADPFWAGSLPGTLNLGNLQPGEKRVIWYTGTVTTDTCPASLTNTAKAVASNASQVTASATVSVPSCVVVTNPKISIKKYVKNNSTSTSYNDSSVDARTGERVNFKVTVSNTGTTTLNNVIVTDRIPDGLQFDDSVSGDGTASFNNSNFKVDFGSISAGQSKTVEFAAKVLATGNTTVCNVAKANASNVNEVSDDACVKVYTTVKPGEPNIVISKRAFNDTKNFDATSRDADRGDYITYTLVATNNGTADKTNYTFEDDLSQVLPLADIVSTNGGVISGNWINYPAITIKPGETVVKTFKVRIKQTLDKNMSYQLKNTYGNTIIIRVPGKFVYVAPTTGAAGTSAGIFAGLLTAGFVVMRKRDSILKFIFA